MKFHSRIKYFLGQLDPHPFFNLIDFFLFIGGIFLGMLKDPVYIGYSIILCVLVYIIKHLLEINKESRNDISDLKNKIGSIIIKKNDSLINYAPFISKDSNRVRCEIIVWTKTNNFSNLFMRIEYESAIPIKDVIDSSYMQQISLDHKSRIDLSNYEYYESLQKNTVIFPSQEHESGKYFRFYFSIKQEYYEKIRISLQDESGKYVDELIIV